MYTLPFWIEAVVHRSVFFLFLKPSLPTLVLANGRVTDHWKTYILLKKLMLACKFKIAATLATSVV